MTKLYYRYRQDNTEQQLKNAEFLYAHLPDDKKYVIDNMLAQQRGELPYTEEEFTSLRDLSSNGSENEDREWMNMWDLSRTTTS